MSNIDVLQQLKNLLEDAKADKLLNSESDSYFKKLIELLSTNKYVQILKKFKPEYLKIDFLELDKEFQQNLIIVLNSIEDKKTSGFYDRSSNTIQINNINFDYKKGEITNLKDKQSTFQHEYAHWFDQQRYKNPKYLDNYLTKNSVEYRKYDDLYYNTDFEIQAHFQGYLSDIVTTIKIYSNYDFNKNLSEVLKLPLMGNFYYHLDEKNKQKITKRLYKLYIYIKNNKDVLDFIGYLSNTDVGLVNLSYVYFYSEDSLKEFEKGIYNKLVSDNEEDSEFIIYAKNQIENFIKLKKLMTKEIKRLDGDFLTRCQEYLKFIDNIIQKYSTGKIPKDKQAKEKTVDESINSLNRTEKNVMVFLLNYKDTSINIPEAMNGIINKLKEKYTIEEINDMLSLTSYTIDDYEASAWGLSEEGILVIRSNRPEKYILTDKGVKVAKKLIDTNNHTSKFI